MGLFDFITGNKTPKSPITETDMNWIDDFY